MAKYTAREWQAIANEKDNFETDEHIISSCDACVGSGKTILPADKMGRFIKMHLNDGSTTVQLFVVPRNSLFNQQLDFIREYLKENFELTEHTHYEFRKINCENRDFIRNDVPLNGHNIFFFNDESLWGTDKTLKDPNRRWHMWIKNFKEWQNAGVLFGECFLDEAHNYVHEAEKIYNPDLVD